MEAVIEIGRFEDSRRRTEITGDCQGARWRPSVDPIALVILALGLALRLFRLDYQSFWGDEIFALQLAREPLDGLLGALAASEPHPPLFYATLHIWRAATGETDFALRLFSTLFSVLAIAAVYGLGRRLTGRRAALSAALLTAINPFQIWYAQETRMYAMLLGLTACSALLFYVALERGGRYRWTAYTVVTALAMYSHYHALFVVIFENVVATLWWLKGRRRIAGWVASQAILLGLFLPWVYLAQSIFRSWGGWMPKVDFVTMLSRTFSSHTLGTSFPEPSVATATLVLAPWSLVALLALGSTRRRAACFIFLYAFVPLAGAYLLGEVLGRSLFHERYLIVVSPAFYLLLGCGLGWRRWRMLVSAVGVMIVGVLAMVSLQNHYFDWRYQKDDLRGLAQYIDAHARDGDFVVVSITRQQLYQRYAKVDVPTYLIPPQDSPEQAVLDVSRAVAGYQRLWFLPYARSEVDLAIDRWIAANAFPAEVRWFNTARVVLAGMATPDLGLRPALSFDRRIGLRDYAVSAVDVLPGDVIGLAANWRLEQPLWSGIKGSLRLLDAHGHVYAQSDPSIGQAEPRPEWSVNAVFRENYGLLVPVDAPPGDYRLELRLYDAASSRELPVTDDAGADLGTSVVLGKLSIKLAQRPAPAAAQAVARKATAEFGRIGRLAGFAMPEGKWRAGDRVPITLSWQAIEPDGEDYKPTLRLLDAGRVEVAKHVVALSFPTSRWRPGELLRYISDWRLPPGLAAATYQIVVSVETANGAALPLLGGGAFYSLAEVSIAARAEYRPPTAPQHTTYFKLGDFAALTGYDLVPASLRPGETLRLTLHWQALAETDESYKVFTHLLSADGRVWGQQDAPPCGGECPTSGWAPGAVFADQYALALQPGAPAGTYGLEIGMYRPNDGARLPVSDEAGQPLGDRIVLAEVGMP